MEAFAARYGLLAVFVGMWVEGETVLVLSGFLAHQRLFAFWALLPVAFLGAFSVDNAYYAAGRFLSGKPFVRRFLERPALRRLDRFGENWAAFFLVRFLYGTRSPFMVYLGSRPLPYLRFVAREIPAVAVWCLLWVSFGHGVGRALVLVLGELRAHERAAAALLVLLLGSTLSAAVVLWNRARRRAGSPAAGSP